MQKAIVFHDTSWGGDEHIPMMSAVVRSGYVPVVKDYLAGKSFLRSLQEAGNSCLDWDEFLDDSKRRQIEVECTQRIEKVLKLMRQPDVVEGFASKFGHFLTVKAQPFFNSLIGRFRDQIVQIETLKEIQKHLDVALIVLGYDFLDHARALIAYANKIGAPTLGLTHAQVNNDQSARYRLLAMHDISDDIQKNTALNHIPVKYADYLAVDGEVSARHIVNWNGDEDRIFVTGSTRPKAKPPAEHSSLDKRSEIKKQLGLDPNRKAVLFCGFFTHGQQGLYGLMSRNMYTLHKTLFDTVNSMQDVQLVVRPHPAEKDIAGISSEQLNQLEDRYKDWLSRQGYDHIHLIRDRKEEVFTVADVVVVYCQSSVLPELMRYDIPVIGISFHERLGSLYAREEGILVLRQVGDLADVLRSILKYDELQKALVERQSRLLPAIDFNGDGRSVERATHLILQLAQNPENYSASKWEADLDEERENELSLITDY